MKRVMFTLAVLCLVAVPHLLQSAPALLYIVSDSLQREVAYSLEGELGLDLPMVRPVPFEASGSIRLQARAF